MHTLRGIFEWWDKIVGSDAIHWNNGLWDICSIFEKGEPFIPLEFYIDTMERIAKELLKATPNVIFATTTPVLEGHPYNSNELIDKYNAAVVPRLKALGVKINDLHSLVKERASEYIKDDLVHLNEKGIDAAARRVADCILEILNK